MMNPASDDEGYSYPLHMLGSASATGQQDEIDDIIKRLHDVVREVTGRPVETAPKPRIGFLP